jgi:hypothetical protein
MMLYPPEVVPYHWQDPLLGGSAEPNVMKPFSAHTAPTPKNYQEQEENN